MAGNHACHLHPGAETDASLFAGRQWGRESASYRGALGMERSHARVCDAAADEPDATFDVFCDSGRAEICRAVQDQQDACNRHLSPELSFQVIAEPQWLLRRATCD
ncbi:hypothetical protein PAGU2638_28540 [Lysobacter sp. PAGU 2638]